MCAPGSSFGQLSGPALVSAISCAISESRKDNAGCPCCAAPLACFVRPPLAPRNSSPQPESFRQLVFQTQLFVISSAAERRRDAAEHRRDAGEALPSSRNEPPAAKGAPEPQLAGTCLGGDKRPLVGWPYRRAASLSRRLRLGLRRVLGRLQQRKREPPFICTPRARAVASFDCRATSLQFRVSSCKARDAIVSCKLPCRLWAGARLPLSAARFLVVAVARLARTYATLANIHFRLARSPAARTALLVR